MNYTTQPVPLSYTKLNGGLNTNSGPLGLEENESPDLQNIDFDKGGSFKQRQGYTALNTSSVDAGQPIDGLHWFITASIKKPIMVCNSKVYRMDDSWINNQGWLRLGWAKWTHNRHKELHAGQSCS